MMSQAGGWMIGGVWLWSVLGVLVVIAVVVKSLTRKK